ncbi:PH domain-containing protein [Haladaptatus salinisoli]|uniref:PH domain-containing protein n=1 Tax=Haladaptatus salinisoli TaxID=2884876 RepID=UPI001D0B24EF|nr:PH domain-containing protein [Haladaptatus salinisoli]
MARGKTIVWSSMLGLPFVLAGGLLLLDTTRLPTTFGLPFVLFGLFVIGTGAYVQWQSSPNRPHLRDGEELVDYRHPTQRVAAVKIALSYPCLFATMYLLFFTFLPYVYPTVALVIGLYLFSTGVHTYWTNSLTTYFITSDRILKEYQFVSRVRREVPLNKVRGVEERKSITEALVGLGNVRVATGGGRSLEIVMQNMDNSNEFANQLRDLL